MSLEAWTALLTQLPNGYTALLDTVVIAYKPTVSLYRAGLDGGKPLLSVKVLLGPKVRVMACG